MNLITLFIFAVGLCFDSFAVSLSCGMSCCHCNHRRVLRFATVLGLCQGLMPLIGWAAAVHFRSHIEAYDHWIAFGLLLFLGVRMIRESRSEEESEIRGNPFDLGHNMVLGVATSIDALVAGIAIGMLPLELVPGQSQLTNMLVAVVIIALVTILSSLSGIYLGRTSRGRLGSYAEVVGGVILILIGTKVLCEHLLEL